MSYATGSTSGQIDFLSKLSTFINTVSGWTEDFAPFTAPDDAADKQMHIHYLDGATSVFLTLVTRLNATYPRLRFQCSLAIDNAQPVTNQPSSPGATTPYISIPVTDSMTYYFFAESTYLVVIIATSGGWYQGFIHALVNKLDTYAGGYVTLGSWMMYGYPYGGQYDSNILSTGSWGRGGIIGVVANPVSNLGIGRIYDKDGAWRNFSGPTEKITTLFCNNSTARLSLDYYNIGYPINFRNHPNTLNPNIIELSIWDEKVVDQNYEIGKLPAICYVSMDGLSPGQEITIGSDTYKCFPLWSNAADFGGGTAIHWQRVGVAVKKVV